MAKKVSENNITDMSQDWGLDSSNNLPYSGAAVQKFIKEKLNSKMGYFYYDASSNRYLCFADEASKDEYIEDPTLTDLVLGAFDAPFNYEASITMLTPSYNAVFLGSTGNFLDFTFDIKNKEGNSTGENVNVTYTFIRNATKKVVTESRKYGESVHFNIDDYILEGTNTIIVGVTGQTTLAATTAAITYQVVNLSYSDSMDISKVYDLSEGSKTVEVFFSVSGYGTKTVEWFIDGQQMDFVKTEDEVVDVTSQRTKYIELSNLASGIHTLQSRAYTIINGEKFYTDTLYREIMVNNGDLSGNLVAVAAELPNTHGIVTDSNPLALYGIEQYIPYEVRFATRRTGDVSIYLGGELMGTVTSTAGTENTYSITSNKSGTLSVKFSVDGEEREIPASVNGTSLGIGEITTSLGFDFRAVGKSNTSVDKDQWTYGDYTGTFSGFNWNASSGWVDNALLINSGASFSVDITPLATDATSLGKTLEFEFSTRNVEDDDAVVCDLTTNGVGLLITASEARLTSAAGEVVSTRFKSGEVNRIAFVVNRKTGVTYKGLAFIYVNGILSGAVNYGSADNFISAATLSFAGTDNVQVELRSMRFYDMALSAENVLNNYILYRDTLAEMMEVYYRNEVYEEGTETFSPDLMLHRLPVMVITGDIPTLESATSTSTQILVDIEYNNEQDPTKNFTMKNAALRIQGTSSLAYPRKNFRFYTQKEESTVVYDAEGNILTDKLYSFKDGAQPVNCWCLKADFAESSGTHNTGIARLWNKAMYGAIIQHTNVLGEEVNGYALRTEAQKQALAEGYAYDVRTTVDGFPIVLFYKKSASDTDLIFLGKYNFNNDKSTPSVFGFEDIPGFDNSRMQCWETKDNGHPLGLFTDVSGFDANWSDAFESRYPDTKSPDLTDLKAFSVWMNGVSQEDFATEKWAHMDVYKVAAYYCYLMRFGAVDQPVKNAFLTSEDGEHFYYINYDNDTINGLINTGRLALDPTINRQTVGSDGEYVYAGHESVLWNRCEADAEFMEIVTLVDNALYSAGLRYDEVIAMFNDEQADKWVERVYNQDAEYKYLLPYVNSATNNLFMLQGSRSSHRSWWLSKRFSLYDSLFLSGSYKDRNISFKCLNDTQPGQQFTITAGTAMNYGYGVNNGTREVGIKLEREESRTFTTTDTLNLGDVVKVFAAANLLSIDLSAMASRIAVLDCSAATDPALGSKLKSLILGGAGSVNTELAAISGINVLTALQELNVEDYQNMTSIDLTAQKDLRKVYAKGSGVASIDFAVGAPVEHLELPAAMMAINLLQLPYLTWDNLVLENGFTNVHTVSIYGCPELGKDFSVVQQWLDGKTTDDISCTLAMDNVDWENVSVEDFLTFSRHKTAGMKMELMGKVYLTSVTLQQAAELQEIWGEGCFDINADFRIMAPDALYINPEEVTLNEGESVQFSYVLFSNSKGSVAYRIVSGSRTGTSIDEATGLLTTEENGTDGATLYVRAIYTSEEGSSTYAMATVNIKKRVYPDSGSTTLSGADTVSQDEVYTWSTTTEGVNGDMVASWALTGDAVDGGYIRLGDNDLNSCKVEFVKAAEMGESVTGTLTLSLKKKVDGSVVDIASMALTMAMLSYPTADDTTVSGETTPSTDNPVYTWESTAEGLIGPFTAEWTLDEEILPYYEIQSQQWDESDPLHGSCTLVKVMDVELYLKGKLHLTVTYTNTGDSFTVSKELVIISPDVIMTEDTNPAVMEVMYSAGLCANSAYMTKAEAEAVTDGTFNPDGTSSGSIFYGNTTITSFDELRYFTGMTTLDAYAFYECTALASLKIPDTITNFGAYCCYRGSSKCVHLSIESINVETVASYAFYASSSRSSENGSVQIDTVNWNCTNTGTSSIHYFFYYVHIMQLNVYSISAGVGTSSTSNQFYKVFIHNITVDDNITSIPDYAFDAAYIYGLELPDSVTILGINAFSVNNSTGFYVNRMSNAITSMGYYSLEYVTFTCDVDFRNLKFASVFGITYATWQGRLDFSKNIDGGSTMYLNQVFIGLESFAELYLPERSLTYSYNINNKGKKFGKVYIPSMMNFCTSTFDNEVTPIKFATELYAIDINSGEYVQVTEFNPTDYLVDSISAYAFQNCTAITGYDATGIKEHNTYSFYGSGITSLKLDNSNGEGSIAAFAFASCASLQSIVDNSTQPWSTLDSTAFDGVNASVAISSQVFGLYKQTSGTTLSPMESDVVYALAFGDHTFTCPNGTRFSDGTTSKTLTLGYTGLIEDLTQRLKIGYTTLVINSNTDDAKFTLSYDSDGSGWFVEKTVSAGTHLLDAPLGTVVTITPATIKYYAAPAATSVTMGVVAQEITMDYTEDSMVYIAHKDGTLYTTDEWTAGSYSNDDAEGVCVMRAMNGGFVISKKHSEINYRWGGYDNTVPDIVTSTLESVALLDMDGVDNTPKIIEYLADTNDGYSDGSPAASYCATYEFPSGATGYLPALGEWQVAYDNKAAVESAMTLIDGKLPTLSSTTIPYATSTQYDAQNVWGFDWNSGAFSNFEKSGNFFSRAFSSISLLITSNLSTKFTVSYTDNYGEQMTQVVGAGRMYLNVKNGTEVTVTPEAIGLLTAEPQTFTWSGFTHECNFVFAKDAGVYIQHIDGSLYTEDEWTEGGYSNEEANGVALLSSTANFVVAKEDLSDKFAWGGYGVVIPDIITSTYFTVAQLDMDGIGNTSKIINYLTGTNDGNVDGAPAAEAAAAYTFPNGATGYLPALGELSLVKSNGTAFKSALTLIGGSNMSTSEYSSTQHSDAKAWYGLFYLGFISTEKGNLGDVRPFTTL